MLCHLIPTMTIILLQIAPGIGQETEDQEEKFFCPPMRPIRKGITWGTSDVEDFPYLIRADCRGDPSGPCDPWNGDTYCWNYQPILCINDVGLPRPPYDVPPSNSPMPAAYFRGWSGGFLAQFFPVLGYSLTPSYADSLYSIMNGPGFRMAEFSDGKWGDGMDSSNYYGSWWPAVTNSGGFTVPAYGYPNRNTRFWTKIDSTLANCWDP